MEGAVIIEPMGFGEEHKGGGQTGIDGDDPLIIKVKGGKDEG